MTDHVAVSLNDAGEWEAHVPLREGLVVSADSAPPPFPTVAEATRWVRARYRGAAVHVTGEDGNVTVIEPLEDWGT